MAEAPKTPKAREELDDLEVSKEESERVRGGAVAKEQGDGLSAKASVKGVQPPLNASLL